MSQITKPDATLQLLIVNMSKFSTPDATPFEIAQFTVARLQLLTFFNLVWYLHTILTLPVIYIVYIYIYYNFATRFRALREAAIKSKNP